MIFTCKCEGSTGLRASQGYSITGSHVPWSLNSYRINTHWNCPPGVLEAVCDLRMIDLPFPKQSPSKSKAWRRMFVVFI